MSDNKHSPAEDVDAIPVSGIKPAYIAGGAGFVALVIVGVVMFNVVSGSKAPEEDPAVTAAAGDTSGMTAEERKAHLELTRKGLAIADGDAKKAEAIAAAKKAEEEAAKKAEEAPAPQAGGGAPAPKKTSGAAAKKQAAGLDDIASDITGALK